MPIIGYVDEATIFSVSGWMANTDNLRQTLTAVIFVDHVDIGRVEASLNRKGLETIAPGATGKYMFKYYFDAPLSPFTEHDIVVRAVPGYVDIEPGVVHVASAAKQPATRPTQPLRPMLLTTMGRSGSTLLMSILAAHPHIVVADQPPFEVELLTYYAYALRHLISPGDHERSLRPDQITAVESRFSLGWNPYFEASHRLRFKDQTLFAEFLANAVPPRLAAAFHDIVLEFYKTVAVDQGKSYPLYFAEKALPEDLIRKSARYMFGPTKEVVLVRDLRDAVVSFMQYGKLDFELAFESLASSAKQILRIRAEASDDVHFVKYEDLVEQPAATIDRILAFLGLNRDFRIANQDALFKVHATSSNPRASVGRWMRDLTPEALERCVRFAEFHKVFGYDALDGVVPSRTPAAQPPAAPALRKPAVASPQNSPHELMLRFESIGENCEFGLVQRQCGAEPLGLLRFASAPLPKLLNALDAGFEGMGLPEHLEVQVSASGREYMVLDKRFGFLHHAWVKVGEQTPEQIHAREVRRVPFLVQKLIEDLRTGEKVFVYHGMRELTDTDALDLLQALRRYGEVKMLWVERANGDREPGTVDVIDQGFYKGYVDRFAPGENAHDLSLDCWINLCRNALSCGL